VTLRAVMSRLDEIAERLTAIENVLAEMRDPAGSAAQKPPSGQEEPAGAAQPAPPAGGGEPSPPTSGQEAFGEPEPPAPGAERRPARPGLPPGLARSQGIQPRACGVPAGLALPATLDAGAG